MENEQTDLCLEFKGESTHKVPSRFKYLLGFHRLVII